MLLGPECLPLSVVKQMCYFFALNSQSIDLKDAFFFGSANFFLHPLLININQSPSPGLASPELRGSRLNTRVASCDSLEKEKESQYSLLDGSLLNDPGQGYNTRF